VDTLHEKIQTLQHSENIHSSGAKLAQNAAAIFAEIRKICGSLPIPIIIFLPVVIPLQVLGIASQAIGNRELVKYQSMHFLSTFLINKN
jgi:hypothetical protein